MLSLYILGSAVHPQLGYSHIFHSRIFSRPIEVMIFCALYVIIIQHIGLRVLSTSSNDVGLVVVSAYI